MNRRHFLRNGLWVTAGAVGFPAIVRAAVMPSARRIAAPTPQQAAGGFTYYATTFGGTSEYLRYNTSTLAETKSVTFSCWFKFASDSSMQFITGWRNDASGFRRDSDNLLRLFVRSGAHNPAWVWKSSSQFKIVNGWTHVAVSFHSDSTTTRSAYINGVAQSDAGWTTYFTGETVLAADNPTLSIGGTYAGTSLLNGCISELYLSSQYTDLSSTIGAFYNAGHPADLGVDGATPTGVQPEYYFKNPYGTFNVNAGSLSATLTVFGSLSSCTPP